MTQDEIRKALGGLADLIMPHLMGKPVVAADGLDAMSRAKESDFVPNGLALDLMPFQRAGVEFALKARRALIGDEMGLGKTPQAIATVVHEQAFPALVVCPPSLTLNWQREFGRFAPQVKVERLSGTKPGPLPAADVYIIGDAVLAAWADTLIEVGLRAMVVDESHRMKNRQAKRTKAALEIARKVDRNGLVLLLSGTAVVNRPVELLSQVQILGLTNSVFGGITAFLNRYAPQIDRWGTRGAANLSELHQIMRDRFYIRRLRDEVLDLPGKDRMPVAVEFSAAGARAYKSAEEDLRSFLRETKGERAADKAMQAEALVRLNTLRRLAGQAKVTSTIEYVKGLVEQDEQVIVFAIHRDVVKAIAEAFDAPVIMGGMSVAEVEAAKAKFQSGEAKVIVLNIQAGGVGHTLTAARHVVFAELAWTPGEMRQAEDRADRIGQTRRVLSHWLLGANGSPTIDERLASLLLDKAAIVGQVLDGEVDEILPEESIAAALLAAYED